jgi:carbon-monoxide dehydrogenase large subunit
LVKPLICSLFKLPESKVRIQQPYQGGSFGNRLFACVEPMAVLMALKTKSAVEFTFSRSEMYKSGPSNWPITTYIKMGAKKDGTIVAQQIRILEDSGATLNSQRDGRTNASAAICVYDVPNVSIDSYSVNTNTPPVGSYRGLGAPQVEFGVELQVDLLARKLGISPLEIRLKNVLKRGEKNAYGEVVTSIGAAKCLKAVSEAIEYGQPSTQEPGPWRKGKGIALGGKQNTPLGRSEADVLVHSDGSIEALISCDEQGMGAETAMAQIVAEQFGISANAVRIVRSDTNITPYDNWSASSRTTYNTGNAVLLACRDAIRQLCEAAGREVGIAPHLVEIKGGKALITGSHITELPVSKLFKPFSPFAQQQWGLQKGTPVRGHGVFCPAPAVPWKEEDGLTPRMWNWYQYSATAVEVAVNIETGEVKVVRGATAADMGFPINPKMCEAQIEGGFSMASSYARNEEYLYDKDGRIINGSFQDYRVPTVLDTPLRANFKSLLVPDKLPDGPYGAKGMAECNTVPVGPAIASAIYDAVGISPTIMPMSAERILQLLKDKEMGKQDA